METKIDFHTSTYLWLFLLIGLNSCACPCHKSGPCPVLRFDGPIEKQYLDDPGECDG